MKAHDVRHLHPCPECGRLGDDREMPRTGQGRMHGRCAYKLLGTAGILKLPASEQAKFTLDDIGPKAMKRLVDALTPQQRPEE